MKPLKNIQNIYFIGIGGIGMSALALYFHREGKNVAGYDKTPSDVTAALQDSGIKVHFEDKKEGIDNSFSSKEDTLVVFTPAIPKMLSLIHI